MNIQLQFKVTYLNLGHGVVQTVSLWPLTAEARARSQASPCGICEGQSGIGRDSSPSVSILPLSVLFHQCSNLIFIYMLFLPHVQAAEAREHSKKQYSFQNQGGGEGGTGQQSTFNLSKSTKFSRRQ